MNIDDYQKIIEKDFSILTDDKIEDAINTLPYDSAKWAKFLYNETINFQISEAKHFLLLRELQEFYDGTAQKPYQKKILKTQVDMYIKSDSRYIDSNSKLKLQEVLVKYLQNIYDHYKFTKAKVLHDKIDLMKYFSGRGI